MVWGLLVVFLVLIGQNCYILPESGHHKPGKKTEKKHKIKYGVINLCSKAYISLEI